MDMVYCTGCAKEIHKTARTCPGCGAPQAAVAQASAATAGGRSTNWFLEPLRKYATFTGRARRKEYWYFVLFCMLINIALAVVGVSIVSDVFSLAVFIPSIAVGVRRMHDTGRSGWWLLLPIVNIVFLAQNGQPGPNEHGADPKIA